MGVGSMKKQQEVRCRFDSYGRGSTSKGGGDIDNLDVRSGTV